MRRSIATMSAVVLGLALTQGTAHAAPSQAAPAPKPVAGAKPAGVNPFLALPPAGTKVDYHAWTKYLKAQASSKAAARLKNLAATNSPALKVAAAAPVAVDEDEPDGTSGSNDSTATAQEIALFGTAANKSPKIRILGSLDNEAVSVSEIAPSTEDDGDIPAAADTGVNGTHDGATTTGTIGDGPYGSAGTGTNDYDFYSVTANTGQVITVKTATPTGDLDSVVALYDAEGTLVAFNDDFSGLDSQLQYRVPATGTFYAAVAGFGGEPVDPFDSSVGFGGGSEGPYTVTVTAGSVDADFYAVKLRAGDVLGASVKGSATSLDVYDSAGRLVHGSEQDASFIYPFASPLPGGGNAANDYVATTTGWYYLGLDGGSGAYDVTVEGYRPVLQGAKPTQTLFLDFDGARANTGGVFGGTGNVTLSPFSAFVAKWGLTNADRDRLIDAVTAGVTENIRQDMIEKGLNARFKLKVTNSKDDPDTWGKPNVSRIIVGGTIAESGIPTIGIAESIDPGNFATQETAFVLLDELSQPAGPEDSLNTYITPESDKVAFIGHALGNVIAHEGGHFFGDFHTDNEDDQVNVMDAGGTGFANLFGVGGTADDPDVDFGEDQFIPAEGFTGIEDTLGRIDFGVTS
jgi:Bacterial pre-peptidase C-terminal domain